MTNESETTARLPNGITREVLEQDGVRHLMAERHPEVRVLSDDELHASLDAILRNRPDGGAYADPVWLFAYGSLLWNPCVHVDGDRLALLRGYHRDFRLRLEYGRGSPERPGLMLGLTAGGSCRAEALRIAGPDPVHELRLTWRRELLTGVYQPRWVQLETDDGRLDAVAFVVDTGHPCYQGRLDDAGIIEYLATGEGMIGSSADYLESTVAALDERGIHDQRLHRLRDKLRLQRAR